MGLGAVVLGQVTVASKLLSPVVAEEDDIFYWMNSTTFGVYVPPVGTKEMPPAFAKAGYYAVPTWAVRTEDLKDLRNLRARFPDGVWL